MAHQIYTVKTQDVDGRTTNSYKTWAAAAKRFEEMSGHTPDAALAFNWADHSPAPSAAEYVLKGWIRTVSDYGTRVVLSSSMKF